MSLEAIAKPLRVAASELEHLEQLSEEELETLQRQLASARVAQHEHVQEATKAAVDQLPRLLRKPVLKMFEGL